ncbi:hypothetical protein CDD81_2630 [Ophiocordyceps australis]|uniref:Adenosine deaminase domain-containing protein n=1 Tax=Ophiocordyceps australis TaxID=1399860 RepID=A0A2C5XXM7_9HYPO|nr:hypothetical protein CDD81_2630 [Ophiocordyceps australis]
MDTRNDEEQHGGKRARRSALAAQMEGDQGEDVMAGERVLAAHAAAPAAAAAAAPPSSSSPSSSPAAPSPSSSPAAPSSSSHASCFHSRRSQLLRLESSLALDARTRSRASSRELAAAHIIAQLRLRDDAWFAAQPPRRGHAGQSHRRFAGDHFLANAPLIARTALFDAARRLPKGAHLHIHYNACLPPRLLLGVAAQMDRMFVSSNVPLCGPAAFDCCELQFALLSLDRERHATRASLFAPAHQPHHVMSLADFIHCFPRHYPHAAPHDWLAAKLVFDHQEAHDPRQTAEG